MKDERRQNGRTKLFFTSVRCFNLDVGFLWDFFIC